MANNGGGLYIPLPDRRHQMGRIGEVESLRDLNHIARGREDEDLVLIEIELQELEELIGRLGVELELEDLAEPGEMSIELVRALRVFLVQPMRGNSEIRRPVHLARADLDF